MLLNRLLAILTTKFPFKNLSHCVHVILQYVDNIYLMKSLVSLEEQELHYVPRDILDH
jgi:uncharacterized membrane protein YkvI